MEYIMIGAFVGIPYFFIYRNTSQTKASAADTTYEISKQNSNLSLFSKTFEDVVKIIYGLDKRLNSLETEIKLREMDSARIIEWLDKRDKALLIFQENIKAHLKIEEREKRLEAQHSKIIEISHELRLIRSKK